MPDYYSEQCTPDELPAKEVELRSKGFRFSGKSNENELEVMEYLKYSTSGSENSFFGPVKWTLVRRVN